MAFPILFKALSKQGDPKQWIYGTPTRTQSGFWMFPNGGPEDAGAWHTIPFLPQTLCQFIGLTGYVEDDGSESSQSAIKLFTGDIVEMEVATDEFAKGVICWTGDGFGLSSTCGVYTLPEPEDDHIDVAFLGNIFDPSNANISSKQLKTLLEGIEDFKCVLIYPEQ